MPSHEPSACCRISPITFGDEQIEFINKLNVEGYAETIFQVSAELQLALSTALCPLQNTAKDLGDIQKRFRADNSQVECEQIPDEAEMNTQLYDS